MFNNRHAYDGLYSKCSADGAIAPALKLRSIPGSSCWWAKPHRRWFAESLPLAVLTANPIATAVRGAHDVTLLFPAPVLEARTGPWWPIS